MSLINNMLSDLDARRPQRDPGSAFALEGLRPVQSSSGGRVPISAPRLIALAALIGGVAACIAWYALTWLDPRVESSPSAVEPEHAVPAPPAANTSKLFELPVAPDPFADLTSGVPDGSGSSYAPDPAVSAPEGSTAPAAKPGGADAGEVSASITVAGESITFMDVGFEPETLAEPPDAERVDGDPEAPRGRVHSAAARPAPGAEPPIEYAGTIRKQARGPDDDPASGLRAAAEMSRHGRRGEALTAYARLIERHPGFVEAHEAYAAELLRNGEREAAGEVLRSALGTHPGASRVAKMLAHLLVGRGQVDEALGVLASAAPPVAADPEYHAFIAALQQRAGHHDAAIASYRTVLEHVSQRGVWWTGLAISLVANNEPEQAQLAFERALDDGELSASLRRYATRELSRLSGSS